MEQNSDQLNQKNSFLDRANNWTRNSVMLRIFTIAILVLLLLIPVSMVQDLIRERERRQNTAIQEVSSKWGNSQTINGIILTIPYMTYVKVHQDKDQFKMVEKKQYAHFLPDDLKISGEILPEIRYRGIYKVIVYQSKLEISGSMPKPSFEDWKIKDSDILWDEASVSLGLSDLRGIQEAVNLQWNGKSYQFDPGVISSDIINEGISTLVNVEDIAEKDIAFNLDLSFNGSTDIKFIPLGKTTSVSLTSPWEHPSFNGAYLPDDRTIGTDGFQANWEVLHLNRAYPQKIKGANSKIYGSAFGVNLIVPIDTYQKSMRSAKYASLFITLTFLIFFFVQILNKVRIHPMQYIIVGLALCIFYILLIALSEHITFKWSYVISSISIISMITLYAQSIAKSIKLTSIIGLILLILYAFIYSILQLQDHALLLGSIGLFIVMAIVMYLSRKIDWFNISK